MKTKYYIRRIGCGRGGHINEAGGRVVVVGVANGCDVSTGGGGSGGGCVEVVIIVAGGGVAIVASGWWWLCCR